MPTPKANRNILALLNITYAVFVKQTKKQKHSLPCDGQPLDLNSPRPF